MNEKRLRQIHKLADPDSVLKEVTTYALAEIPQLLQQLEVVRAENDRLRAALKKIKALGDLKCPECDRIEDVAIAALASPNRQGEKQ